MSAFLHPGATSDVPDVQKGLILLGFSKPFNLAEREGLPRKLQKINKISYLSFAR
jgi:hypothetical protein